MIELASAAFSKIIETHRVFALHLTVHGFLQAPFALFVGFACLVVGVLQVRRGLVPVGRLQSKLSGLRDGHDRRIEGEYPSEVQPLVDDLNALLAQREQAVKRAIAKAGDLAHGLKTPLAILAQEAEQARAAGQQGLAAAIAQQVERMRRQIDYHLAHARAAASGGSGAALTDVRESVAGLTRTLQRLYADRGIVIDVAVPDEARVKVQREDLDEMLGNVLDNACKWAATRVTVGASIVGATTILTIDDDGRGLAAEMREAVLQRGVRADEAAPGSGLGLAIVADLAELYGGSIALEESPYGGLRATLRLPGA
jgi:signal transduction histidine kinase